VRFRDPCDLDAIVEAIRRGGIDLVEVTADTPGAILAKVNQALCRDLPPNMFVTMVVAVLTLGAGRHLSVDGLIEIAEIAETMNRKKPRRDLIRILRDHTPDVRDIG